YNFPAVQLSPAPPRPIPIVIGGATEPALRRTARLGDGWYGPPCSLEESLAARRRIEELRGQSAAAGRSLEYYVRLTGGVDRANVRRFADAAFHHLEAGPAMAPRFGGRS